MGRNENKMHEMTAVKVILLFLAVTEPCLSTENFIEDLGVAQFDSFIGEDEVRVVYFQKTPHQKDQKTISSFMTELEKSSQLLTTYGVKIAKVNCAKEHVKEYCDQSKVHGKIFTFKNGNELLPLSLENMFDVNSIMSNILQIVLLREVPILQHHQERLEFEKKHRGQHDIIFSYQKAIGTYEHRILMEVAYAYHDQFKFAITTEENVLYDLPDSDTDEDAMLWVMLCHDVTQEDTCTYSKYRRNLDLTSLAKFLKYLNMKHVYDITEDGSSNPFVEHNLPTVALYYDYDSKNMIKDVAEFLEKTFIGITGFLLVDVSSKDAAKYGYKKSISPPGIALIPPESKDIIYMEDKEFTIPILENFLAKELHAPVKGGLKLPPSHREGAEENEDLENSVENEDDQVAEAVYRLRNKEIDRTHVPALTDKTFPTQTNTNELLVVLFYLTFDARSMAFLRSYVDASMIMAEQGIKPLAAVDCFDWTDVCGKNNITSYPSVRVYRKGQETAHYKGLLDGGAIISMVKLYMSKSPVYLSSSEEFNEFVTGTLPTDIGSVTNISVIGLFTNQHKKELQAFKEAAKQMEGKYLFGYTAEDVSKQATSMYKSKAPCVVVLKRYDALQPYSVYAGDMTAPLIMEAINMGILAVFPELTAINFPMYFAQKKPFVLLFEEDGTPGKGANKVIGDVANSLDYPQFVFAWMELLRNDGVAGKVLLEYDQNADPPSLACVNHENGHIFNYPKGKQMDEESVRGWLNSIQKGKLDPSKLMRKGDWKPLNPGYDFLKKMDEDASKEDGNSEDYIEEDDDSVSDDDIEDPSINDPNQIELEKETREELQNLRNSRLYNHGNKHKATHENSHPHTEL